MSSILHACYYFSVGCRSVVYLKLLAENFKNFNGMKPIAALDSRKVRVVEHEGFAAVH